MLFITYSFDCNWEIDDIGGKMMMNEEEALIVRLTMLISEVNQASFVVLFCCDTPFGRMLNGFADL